MPVVEELFDGRTEVISDKPSAEIPYIVRQAEDEDEVKAAALAATPWYYAGLPRRSIELAERINEDTWRVTVRYEKPDNNDQQQQQNAPEPVVSFDTGGGTQHITQSLDTRSKYGPAATDELGGAIGYDGENVGGVDITVPVYNFTETHYLPDAVVSMAYRGILFRATGTVNLDPFRGFAPGEVLFLGASGSKRGEEDWEITFKFAALPNRMDIMVGDIGPITKLGWDYMWVQYAPDVDEDKKQLIKKPVAVYIEQVYEESIFLLMGIGG
jgi:hypothetical protein